MVLQSQWIKEWAFEQGFARCGIARARVLSDARRRFDTCLAKGLHADMTFLERDVDKRFNPELLLPGCQSVIVVTLGYLTEEQPLSERYRTARYTWVEDYHHAVKQRLDRVVEQIRTIAPDARCRVSVDSSCISEKNWAVEAGVGCFGKNGLVHNDNGSFFAIGTILADFAVDFYDNPSISDCGNCRLCLDACPAKALSDPYRVDARRCYSYHTIENKNPDNEILKSAPMLFGCDVCQEICPKNKKKSGELPKVLKSSVFLRLQNRDIETLSKEEFNACFGETAIARRKYERFMRAVMVKSTDIQERENLNEKIDILQYAGQVLQDEADALIKLKQYLDEDFESSVEKILNSKGRLVVTGIGKSAIIGQKIVATLNSTGTPAVFMHAADAVHGDLGIIQPDDVVLCISKSGNTPEILQLTPFLKKNGNVLIAMVGNRTSRLARAADYVLDCTVAREASPNNLAPTSSSTAQLALGDALASTLIVLRGFSPEDFAQYHPGGILGKRLSLKVSDLYKFNEVPKVTADAPMQEVILEISGKCLGVTAVVDDDRVVGAITDGDLRRMLQKTPEYSSLTAKDVMTTNPKYIQENTLAVDALDLMKSKNITNLFVVDEQKRYLGVIHIHDLIKEGIY